MGKCSIRTCALLRTGLVQARHAHAREIEASKKKIEDLALALQETGNETVEQVIRDEMSLLKERLLPSQPYTAMARSLINPYLRRIRR